MKTMRLLLSTVIFAMTLSLTVMAGTWKSDANGWWFDEGNGSFPKNTWSWIDGNNDGVSECYYFDQNGYCLINTITPDNYYVNNNGAWTIDGTTQTRGTVTGSGVSHSSGNNVDIVTAKLSIGEKKDKDSKKSKSSSKSSKKNQDEDEDDYDDENEIDDEDEDDSEEESKKKSSKKSDGKKVNFTNNMDMFDLKTESSSSFHDYSPSQSLRGESWEGCKEIYWDGYAEYYIGGKYKKLSIKVTPCTYNGDFGENHANIITITNAETGEELCTKRITHATKIETLVTDVTDVDYVRINSDSQNGGLATVLMKNAILTK